MITISLPPPPSVSVVFSLYGKDTFVTTPSQLAYKGVLLGAAKSQALWTPYVPKTILCCIKKDVIVVFEKSIGGTKGLFCSTSTWLLPSIFLHPEYILYLFNKQTLLISINLLVSLSTLSM